MGRVIRRLPDSELEVMMIIWEADRAVTSAYVSEKLRDRKEWKITSVLTFLARLADKGFVTSTREGKVNLYSEIVSEQEYLEQEGKSFLDRLCRNSLTAFVSSLYNSSAISEEDLMELRQFIDSVGREE